MIKPISLRLRPDEVNRHARVVLRRLDKERLLQRRVKLFALRALSEIYKMNNAAEPQLQSMSTGYRNSWRADYQAIVSILKKIGERGA